MYSSYCKDNNKCDSASNAPKCQLNNGVSIVQKIIVKISNTSTTFFSQQTDPDISIKGGGGVNKKKNHISMQFVLRKIKGYRDVIQNENYKAW